MQKTLTVNGKRYAGKQIASQFRSDNMTNGDDYIVDLNGDRYYANYRQIQDDFWAPVCSAEIANAIKISRGPNGPDYWLSL